MKIASLPYNEKERLESLEEYQVLDSLPEEEYDSITKLAAEICGTPISLITLIDANRQWFKSHHGLDATETPRNHSFCAHGLLNPNEALVVPNSFEDDRFMDNPLVTGAPHVEFYAGIPLVNKEGYALGSLCVIDNQSRNIAPEKIELLKLLAKQVVKLLELRKTNYKLNQTKLELENLNTNLEEFAYVVAHDVKAPIRNMGFIAHIFKEDYEDKLDAEGEKLLNQMIDAADNGIDLINGILNYSKATKAVLLDQKSINLNKFIPEIIQYLSCPDHITIKYDSDLPIIQTSRIAMKQILINLLSNAIKYNGKEKGVISINIAENKEDYTFKIIDNGNGIPADKLDSIFSLFFMVNPADKKEKGSSGIGLSIVKKLVETLGGRIKVNSKEQEGTTFEFSLLKQIPV